MQNTLKWSDVTPGGNSFNMTNIADSSPEQNNIHSYNHKVIYTTMIKNSKGGYGYKMEFNSSDCQKMLIILSVLRFKLQIIDCGINYENFN